MPEPIDENVKAAVKAFEDADDLFQEEPGRIFGTESERKAALYATLTKKWKAWERSGPCMYRGCPNTSITRSHSIHRAGPMEQIAEQQACTDSGVWPERHDPEPHRRARGVQLSGLL